MGKFSLALLVLATAIGCSETIVYRVPQETALAPVVGTEESVADRALSALVLWQDATGGAFAPDAHIGCDGTEDLCIRAVEGLVDHCGEADELRGCMRLATGSMDLGTATPIDQQVSTLCHEIGHFLGLEHAAAGLMNNQRPKDERRLPCIDSATVAAFSAEYPGVAAEPACYGDDTRARALDWLAAIE